MALNWVQLKPSNNQQALEPLCLPGETIIQAIPTVELQLQIPPTTEGPKRKEDAWGKVFISDKRIIFLGYTPKTAPSTGMESQIGYDHDAPRMPPEFTNSTISSDGNARKEPTIKSLSLPYAVILQTKFNQPLFSTNNITIQFMPVPDGNLPSPGRGSYLEIKLAFKEGKVHEFWKLIEATRAADRTTRLDAEALPRYEATAAI